MKVIQIKFVCKSCEHSNSMETGMDGYEQRQTEFSSLSDAFVHLYETYHGPIMNSIHEMTIEIEEEK